METFRWLTEASHRPTHRSDVGPSLFLQSGVLPITFQLLRCRRMTFLSFGRAAGDSTTAHSTLSRAADEKPMRNFIIRIGPFGSTALSIGLFAHLCGRNVVQAVLYAAELPCQGPIWKGAYFRLGAKMGKLAATGLGEPPCPAPVPK
jgi:hypothetical protein